MLPIPENALGFDTETTKRGERRSTADPAGRETLVLTRRRFCMNCSNPEENGTLGRTDTSCQTAILVNISKEVTGPKTSRASFDKARSKYPNSSLALS